MLGDILTSTIIADQLKKEHPDCTIGYLIKKNGMAILEHHPSIDQLVVVEERDFNSYLRLHKLAHKLRSANYDVLIDIYGKNNSAILSKLSGIPKRIGYDKWFSSIAYTTYLKNDPEKYQYETGSSIVSRLLLTIPLTHKVDWSLRPKIYLSNKEIEQGRAWLSNQGLDLKSKITMVSALGSSDIKTLPFKTLALIIDYYVARTQSQLLFNYIPAQRDQAMEIFSICRKETQQFIFINSFASSIRDFLKVLYHCNAVIGNEGGAINMAKALNVPTFSIFSPWIEKNAWNNDEDGDKNIAVHLKDKRPELFLNKTTAELKKLSLEVYEGYRMQDVEEDLLLFIRQNNLLANRKL